MFRLALLLGRTVGELERSMTSAELSEWIAFTRVHPLPDGYWETASVCHTLASINHSGTGRRPRFEDFLPVTRSVARAGKSLRNMLIARFRARKADGSR